ncbi:tetraspanin-9 [Nematostella vectensis]|uniref:tetraspanin-9 n=1 Tax=Nematostella vectensis TaxID=45351 RepID=UPI0020777567|nr:tetraspanin-9 [Nematostella vectensis]
MGSLDAGAGRILKILVVFFNVLFFIFGIALIAVGAWAEVQYGEFIEVSSVPYATGSRLVIAVGVIIAIVSFFGCLGAWKENRCMLGTFFVLLLILLALEIAAAVLAYNYRGKVKDEIESDLTKALKGDYGSSGQDGVTKAFDALQEKQKCCGVNGYLDWKASKKYNGTSTVPDSCCVVKADGCGKAVNGINKGGCFNKMVEVVKDKLDVIGGFAITMLVIQILGTIFALVLIIKIGKTGEYA